MLFELPITVFFLAILFKSTYVLFSKLFPQKAAFLNKIHANILIKHKQVYLVTSKYLK